MNGGSFHTLLKRGYYTRLGVFGHVRQPPTQKAVYGALHARREVVGHLDDLRYY